MNGFNINVSALTHPGKRRQKNQDFVTYFEPRSLEELENSGCLFIVADGVGGAVKGDRASQYAAQKVLHDYYIYKQLQPGDRLQRLLRQVGNEIYDHAELKSTSGPMATTLVAAVLRGMTITVANVGDSRAYLIRDDVAHQITQDHTEAEALVRNGVLTRKEAHYSRSKNKLTRSLGGQQDVLVDIFEDIPLLTGDQVLLCSDGLTRYTTADDLVEFTSHGSAADVSEHMIEFANNAGGADNISVLYISVGQEADLAEILDSQISRAYQPIDLASKQTEVYEEAFVARQVETESASLNQNWLGSYRKHLNITLFVVVLLCIVSGGLVIGNKQLAATSGGQIAVSIRATQTKMDIPKLTDSAKEQNYSQTEPSNTPTQNPLQISPAAYPEYSSNLPSMTNTPLPVPITTAPIPEDARIEYCAVKVNKNDYLENILQKMSGIKYKPEKEYYYHICNDTLYGTKCDSTPVRIKDHEKLQVDWWIEIPDIDKEKCENNSGHWFYNQK